MMIVLLYMKKHYLGEHPFNISAAQIICTEEVMGRKPITTIKFSAVLIIYNEEVTGGNPITIAFAIYEGTLS